jgi:hypothetical protein
VIDGLPRRQRVVGLAMARQVEGDHRALANETAGRSSLVVSLDPSASCSNSTGRPLRIVVAPQTQLATLEVDVVLPHPAWAGWPRPQRRAAASVALVPLDVVATEVEGLLDAAASLYRDRRTRIDGCAAGASRARRSA